MNEFAILFPIPENRRNADDMGMPSPIKTQHKPDPACSGCVGLTHHHTCDDPSKKPKA